MVVMGDELQSSETTVSDYFAAVRLARQEARDSALSLLQEAMAYDTKENSETGAKLDSIVQTALCESQIESLIIAKGYADCVAYISNDGISVAVATPEGGLQQTDVAVIADIVISQSDFTLEDIRVVEVH
jgi:stage III sporulation protein AH